MAEKYVHKAVIGKGGFGCVTLSTQVETNDLFAIKRIPYTHLSRHLYDEIQNHRRLIHPHIVRLYEVYADTYGVNIVMELASRGTLLDYVKNQPEGHLTEDESRWFFQQIAIALDYCHKRNVGHRDIKLENTLLAENSNESSSEWLHAKICDFGFAVNRQGTVAHSRVGTPNYMAPEVLGYNPANTAYNPKKADLWSLGVSLFGMLTGRHAFFIQEQDNTPSGGPAQLDPAAADEYLRQLMLRGCPDLPAGLNVTPECLDLLKRLLNPNPAERITMPEVLDHTWFRRRLSAGVMAINPEHLALEPLGVQSEEEIATIVSKALAVSQEKQRRAYMRLAATAGTRAALPTPQQQQQQQQPAISVVTAAAEATAA